jgi:hypothetical protein
MRIGKSSWKIWVLISVPVLVVLAFVTLVLLESSSQIPISGRHLVLIPQLSGIFYSFDGRSFPASVHFLVNTTAFPIPVEIRNGMLFANNSTLLNLVEKGITEKYGHTFIEKPFVFGNLSISQKGMEGNLTLLLYAGQTVGDGEQITLVYTAARNWTIFTNGTDFIVENGSFKIYSFFFTNYTLAPYVVAIGTKLNNSAVPQSNSLFLQQFLPYLNSVVSNSGLKFVKGGLWWYTGYVNATISPVPLPKNYRIWH